MSITNGIFIGVTLGIIFGFLLIILFGDFKTDYLLVNNFGECTVLYSFEKYDNDFGKYNGSNIHIDYDFICQKDVIECANKLNVNLSYCKIYKGDE